MMNLKILTPTEILLEESTSKIIAEAENGMFCLKPKHIDFVAALVPGIVEFVDEQGSSIYVALDESTLVKCGPSVMISARNAVRGTDLEQLRLLIEEKFKSMDERERHARKVLARLEAGIVRHFIELEEIR